MLIDVFVPRIGSINLFDEGSMYCDEWKKIEKRCTGIRSRLEIYKKVNVYYDSVYKSAVLVFKINKN